MLSFEIRVNSAFIARAISVKTLLRHLGQETARVPTKCPKRAELGRK